MKDSRDRVALVRKNKPTWQAGRLNGIGGGIEANERPIDAMTREWFEETYNWHSEWERFAEIRFPETIVHFFKANVPELPEFPAINDIGEKLEVWDFSIVVRNSLVIPNLKWLLPMAFEDPDAKHALLLPIEPKAWPVLVAANDNKSVNEICAEYGLPALQDAVACGDIMLPVAA